MTAWKRHNSARPCRHRMVGLNITEWMHTATVSNRQQNWMHS